MKAGYIENQLHSESPDVSCKPDMSKGAEAPQRWREALHPRRSQTAEFSKSCSELKQRFRPLDGRPFLSLGPV